MADHTQRVIWTALPNGTHEDGRILVTALASPRLVALHAPVAPLSNWQDFVGWADKMRSAGFRVRFGTDSAEAEMLSEPDQTIWNLLFDGAIVNNHAFEDRRGHRILSYPVVQIAQFVEQVYGDIGLALEDELPTKRDIFIAGRLLGREEDERDIVLQREVLARLDQEGRKTFDSVQGAFTLQEVYNMPLAATDPVAGRHINTGPDDPRTNAEWRQHRFEDLPDAMDFKDRIDFHTVVSALNQYPSLLRRTGLAIDLAVDPGDLQAGPVTDQLQVLVEWSPQNDADVETLDDGRPETVTRRDDPEFAAVPRNPNGLLSDGYLNIDNERLRLVQMDVDGAGVKLRNAIRSFRRTPVVEQDPERAGTPAIRTAGLQLVEVDRHLSLEDAFDHSGTMEDALNSGNPIVLFAEDIVRGYHADVLDQTASKPWQSLCRRDSTYDFTNAPDVMTVEDEEGMIRLGAQEAPDPTNSLFQDLVKIGELVFSWSGWSLTAPRPGLSLSTADDDHPAPDANAAPPGLPMEASFRVRRGSLPALRFGHSYRVRARVADLAGNARRLEEGDDTVNPQASPPESYRRFEPVQHPANALVDGDNGLERPDDGESMARMAIRSFNVDPVDNTTPTAAEIRRWLVPPRISQVMAEQHGALDLAGGRPDPSLYSMIAMRDENLDRVQVLHEDPITASSDLVEYSVGSENLTTPYLPDVLARTAMVRLDFDPKEGATQRVRVPYYPGAASWPDALPFKIRIFEDAGGATTINFDDVTRTLNVPLQKAEQMRVRISHTLDDDDIDLMALWQVMRQRPGMNSDLAEALTRRINAGDHWMLTPWLEMELVHAVQKPLVMPAFLSLGANRALGETKATINYRSPIHSKSTAKAELFGTWREPYDTNNDRPEALNQSGRAFETRLERDSFPNGEIRDVGDHAFGDTRFRRVSYVIEAPTRFPEFMPPLIRQQPDEMKVTSAPAVALVPNASAPPPPEIVEITPTFGWNRTSSRNRVSSFRSGGGLRVWLKRPWFTTGFGEMLGVIVARTGATKQQITGPQVKYVTQWGADPIWRSGRINSASPPVTAFPDRIMGGPIPPARSPDFVPAEEHELVSPFPRTTNLELPESGGTRVDVVPHPVNYDRDRDQYYCDIRVNPGASYYPFIRLALARFHPVSVNGAHLSPVALADYMQLAPDRLLVMSQGSRRSERKLQLFGHAYTRSPFKEERPRANGEPVIRVELQTKDPDLSDELAWTKRETSTTDFLTTELLRADLGGRVLVSEADDLVLAARRTGSAVESVLSTLDLGIFIDTGPPLIWEGTVRVPRRRAGEELRVLVTEFERHANDTDWNGSTEQTRNAALRTVYAEAFSL